MERIVLHRVNWAVHFRIGEEIQKSSNFQIYGENILYIPYVCFMSGRSIFPHLVACDFFIEITGVEVWRWIFVRDAVNYFFDRIHRFHRISYINLPQKSMRWVFVSNAVNFAVNFAVKCGEMRWNIVFHPIHCNHRISHKNSPKNFDPGRGFLVSNFHEHIWLIFN